VSVRRALEVRRRLTDEQQHVRADRVVDVLCADLQQVAEHENGCGQQHEAEQGREVVAELVLPDRAHHTEQHAEPDAQGDAEQEQPQAHADAAAELVGDRAFGDRVAEVAAHHTAHPRHEPLWDRLVEVQVFPLRLDRGGRRGWFALFQHPDRVKSDGGQREREERRHKGEHHVVDQPSQQKSGHPCSVLSPVVAMSAHWIAVDEVQEINRSSGRPPTTPTNVQGPADRALVTQT
jgi:hypothetical protein